MKSRIEIFGHKVLLLKLVLISCLFFGSQGANADVLATKQAFDVTSGSGITSVELGQTVEYAFNWNCNFTGTPPPGECGDFVLVDPLPAGVEYVSCSVPGIYSCTYDPTITPAAPSGTVTIEALDPLALFTNGESATASIIVQVTTDVTELPGGTTDPLVNTAVADSADGPEDVISSLDINEPTNNWEISKSVLVPLSPLEPALDNDVIYQIEMCPNGPAGLGTGTIIIENPTLVDACPTGAVINSATLNGSPVTTTGVCPSVDLTLPATFDPADGCQVVELNLTYPTGAGAPAFAIGVDVTNTATLDGDNVNDDCPGGCDADVTSTLSAPTPGAEISKSVKRDEEAVGAFNRYTINFDTTSSNVLQTGMEIIDIFPTEMEAISFTHGGEWSDTNVTANIIELGTGATIISGYNGDPLGVSHTFAAAATGFQVIFTSDVPPGFEGGSFSVNFRTDSGLGLGTMYTNCVEVSSDQILPADNPEACATVEVIEPSADLNITKNMPAGVSPGATFTTTFDFIQDDTSSIGAVNPVIGDCIPNELEFVSWDTMVFTGLDNPTGAVNTTNTLPRGVEPNFELLAPGATGNNCADATRTFIRWSWKAAAPAGSTQLDGSAGLANPFTFPVRRDNDNDDIEDATGNLGLFVRVRLGVTLQVKPGVGQQNGLSNEVQAVPENTDFRCINSLGSTNADVNDVDGDGIIDATDPVCNRVENYNVLSSAAFSGNKFVAGFPGLPNYDPDNPPVDNSPAASTGIVTPASCPVDADGRTRTPCVAQAMKDQPFDYRIRLSNDGNVLLTDYVAYDILPHTDSAGSDTGISEAQSTTVRGSSWVPLLNAPIVLSSDDPGVASELAANAIIEYSASSNPCRPEMSIADDTLGGDWQAGACVDDWTASPLADATTFPNGYASVRAWRIYVPFASGWRVGDPDNIDIEDIIVDIEMLADPTAPASDYEALPDPTLEIAWNNIAFRSTNVATGRRLLAAEAIKTGIVMPAEYPLESTGLRIGNLVWQDANNDGIAQAGEQGIFDVTVQLWNDVTGDGPSADDILFDTTQTDADGHYLFDDADTANRDGLGIPAGNYYVAIPDAQTGTFVLDDNYSSTTNAPVADNNIDNDDNGAFESGDLLTPVPAGFDALYSGTVNLTLDSEPVNEQLRGDDATDDDDDFFDDDDSNVSVDFGFYQLRLGNHVWLDSDNDGAADATEPAIENVDVQLFLDDGDGVFDPDLDTLLETDTTDAAGQYLFDGLDVGNYFVAIPSSQTGLDAGGTSYATDELASSTATSAAGAALTGDNDDDGAPGTFGSTTSVDYASVSTLLELTVGGAQTAESDSSLDGVNGASSTDPSDANIELQANIDADSAFPDTNSYLTADFGFTPAVSLGSTVWIDANADGTQDPGEGAIEGATVTLLDATGTPIVDATGNPITTTTNADGEYSFNGLPPGTYRVSVDLSTSSVANIETYFPSPVQVADPDNDSNADSNIDFAADPIPADLIHISGDIILTVGGEPENEVDPVNAAGTGVATDSDQPDQTGLADDSGNMTLDMGFVPPVSLGSTLWVDTDADGVQEAGEAPIENALVTLLNGNGTVFDSDPYTAGVQFLTILTDGDGQYFFNDLPPGDYRVSVDLTDATNSNATSLIPTLVNVDDPDANPTAAASGLDSNVDVDNAANDSATDVWVSEEITLSFNGEPVGEVDPIGAGGVDQPGQGLTPAEDPDASGNMTLDMGFIEPVSLGSTVWIDSNLNGQQDIGELPVVGATVTLLDSVGVPVIFDVDPTTPGVQNSVTTDADGQYNFNGLPEGSYFVEVTMPSGPLSSLLPTPTQVAGANTDDSNLDSNIATTDSNGTPTDSADDKYLSELIELTIDGEPTLEVDDIGTPGPDQPNQTATENPDANGNMTIDFGFYQPVSLGSTVWLDTNADGLQNDDELGIQNATVTLLDANGVPIPGVAPVLTDAEGQYSFNALLPGDYRVKVTLPADKAYAPTPNQVADPDAAGDVNNDSNIDLTVPGSAVGAAAGDTATDDSYTSGIITLQPGTEPIGEVDPIDALVAGGDVIDQPNQDLAVGGTNPDSSGNMTLDFGFIEPVSLGSTIWVDDGDGIQESGEAPIVDATVTLLDNAGNPVTFDTDPTTPGIQNSVVTDADGQYNFDGLPEGTYSVSVDLSTATNANATTFLPTPVQVADADADPLAPATNLDSNVDIDNVGNDAATDVWFSEQVTLTVGGEAAAETDPIGAGGADQPNQGLTLIDDPDTSGNMTLDMGFIEPLSLGSTVWFDNNSDGVQDPLEPGIEGVTVTLLNADGTVYDSDPLTPGDQPLVSTTDADGQYNFNGLIPGDYRVQVELGSATSLDGTALNETPTQTADPDAVPGSESNLDSNIDDTAPVYDTVNKIYQSGVVTLSVGGEPTSEEDQIGTPGADQPGQTAEQADENGNMTVDFGFVAPTSLGSTIWEDLNGDGTQDLGELPIVGATVTLLNPNGTVYDSDPNTPGIQAFTSITDVDGQYNFDDLIPGDYRVQVDLSTVVGGSDLFPTPVQVADPDAPGAGLDNNTDSNIDEAFDTDTSDQVHTSGVITLTVGGEPINEIDSIGSGGADAVDQPNQGLVDDDDPDGSGNMTLDMGFVRPVSLGSTIWLDNNTNGMQDDQEPPLVGATVTLLDASGVPVPGVSPVLTDATGQYNFNGLPPGDYRVQVDLSTAAGSSTLVPTPVQVADPDAAGDNNADSNVDLAFDPNPADQIHTSGVITLSAGDEPTAEVDPVDGVNGNASVADQPNQDADDPDNSGNMTVDMGFYAPVSVGSLVWEDTNGDGIQDANEPPLAGASVVLLVETSPGVFAAATQIDGSAVAPVTVGPDGLYEFTNLPGGVYKVQVTPPAGFFPSPVQNTTADDDTVNDSNIADEPTTGVFESASFTVIPGGEPSEAGPDANRGDNQDGVAGGPEDLSGNMTVDFGFVPPASLGNYVWLDLDMDGVQDANEDGIANVTVNLYEDTDGNGVIDGAELTTPVATAVTGPNGEYLFPDLQPGVVYQTGVDTSTLPAGLVQTFDEGDGVGATDSLSDPIVLDPNEFHETADFGYAPPAGLGALGDTVWIDSDDDGVQDPGEPGIAGVTITLTPPADVDLGNGPGQPITTVTDGNGKYLFTNLPLDETYIVEVDTATLPAGYVSGPSNLGDPDVRDGNSEVADDQTLVTLTTEDPINLDSDFGYLPPTDQNNTIGDTLWIDVDEDGNGPATAGDGSDVTEPVLPGVTVTLIQDNGDGVFNPADDLVFASTTTDANGMYLFTGIPDGDYIVLVTDQNNVLAGLDQTVDSDDAANPGAFVAATPNASFVNDLGVGIATPVADLDQDFGYVDSNTSGGDGSIGDTIFFDSNNSGLPEDGEGIEGVVVQLFGPGPDGVIGGGDDILLATTTTDENGNYLFTGLDTSDTGPNPGTEYQVLVDTSTLPNGGDGWSNSVDPDTTGDGDNESVTSLTAANPVDLDQDFGYIGDGDNTISGTVWPDTDGDGNQDEAGIFGGVTIELRDEDGNLLATTVTDSDGNYEFVGLPDGIYQVVVTDEDNVLNGFEHTDSPNGLSDTDDQTSKDDTGYVVDLDSAGVSDDPVNDSTGDFGYQPVITNPISLGVFLASDAGNGFVSFDWSTQSEVGNLGFNLYGLVDGEWTLLNGSVIIAQGDSVSVQSYNEVIATTATIFTLSDIDLTAKETIHGPFMLGEQKGSIADRKVIDWAQEKAEREAKQADRSKRRQEQQLKRGEQLKKSLQLKRSDQDVSRSDANKEGNSMKTFFEGIAVSLLSTMIPEAHAQSANELINLQTTELGIHEVSYADLVSVGLDLDGQDISDIVLSNQGQAVAIDVIGGSVFGQGSSIRFIATQIDTLYTDTNVYTLSLLEDASLTQAPRVVVDNSAIPQGVATATSYMATQAYEPQLKYSFSSPDQSDPFYAKRLVAVGGAVSEDLSMTLSDVVAGGNTGDTSPTLAVDVWGGTDLDGATNDHSFKVAFNGQDVMAKTFDGLGAQRVETELELVKEGDNNVQVTLPLDTGYAFDSISINSVEVKYPRKFVAIDNRLNFESTSAKFLVSGFAASSMPNTTDDLVVMREDVNGVARLTTPKASCRGDSCKVQLGGTGSVAHYYVSTQSSVHKPNLAALPLSQDISSGQAKYLIISHPDFIGANGNNQLEALATEMAAEMGSADVVDVESIYAQFGDHLFDPTAIQDYVKYAHANRGTQYLLLVGGDVYDYRQFENEDATSFIPSLYAATGSNITFAPVDAKYADVDGDNVPDFAVARLPVRTTEQLSNLLAKRTSYMNRTYSGSVLLVADEYDVVQQYDFANDADEINNDYFQGFAVEKAYVDDIGTSAARAKVKQSIEAGTTLTAFFGHSSTNQWSFDGLFTGPDAANLNNAGKPTVVMQWGCWNTYYVSPNEDSMGHQFMMEGDRGAVAVLGASALANADNERKLAKLVFARLANGERLGDAVTNAKKDYAIDNPSDLDILLGFTLLGLPEITVE